MNITIDREVLLDNLNTISRGLPVRTTNPILQNIKIEVTEADMYMTTTNSDISVEVVISDTSLIIEETGTTLIPGKYFIDIIRKINSNKVNIYSIDDKMAIVKGDRGEFKLHIADPLDYPKVEFVMLQNPLILEASVLKSLIKETAFACAVSEKKPVITGVNLKLTDNNLVATATDSFRLAKKNISIDKYDDFEITIPSKSLDEINKVLDQFDEKAELYFESKKLLLKFKNTLFQTRLLDGNYPNTERIIPTTFSTKISFNKDELIDAVERVSLLSPRDKEKDKELSYSIIKLSVNNDMSVILSSNNVSIGDATEELTPTDIETPVVMSFSFSSKYLIEALRSFISTEVTINIVGNMRPFVLTGTQDLNLTQLILPVKMD